MNMLALLLMLSGSEPLLRVTYEVEITEGTRQVTARLILNQLSESTFSIHCTKGSSGTLFTYWATPESNTLYLPKSNLSFVGEREEAFQLFPKGPTLNREAWVKVLFENPPDSLGRFSIADEAGWRLLRNREDAITIRWREKKRGYKEGYSSRVLTPTVKDGTRQVPLSDIPHYWDGDEP